MSIGKDGWVSWAKRKPLGPQTEPAIHPDVMIYHIIVGTAEAGYNVFKPGGYTGDESTWIVCGPRDKAAGHKDGELWQLQDIFHQADAQFAGNNYANSVESSGYPNEPYSSAMLDALIQLTYDWCKDRKIHAQLVPKHGPVGKGLGYHELRDDWNTDHHVCPGAVREGQLRQIVIPKARARLLGDKSYKPPRPKPHPPYDGGHIRADGVFGTESIGAVQHMLKHYLALGPAFKVDGIFGPDTRRKLKVYLHQLGFKVDTQSPDIGEAATRALQQHVQAEVTGHWTKATTRHIQRALNDGRF